MLDFLGTYVLKRTHEAGTSLAGRWREHPAPLAEQRALRASGLPSGQSENKWVFIRQRRQSMKYMLDKLLDFLVNFAVASFAVSAYQGVWYGFAVGSLALLFVIVISVAIGGKK